MFAREHFYSSYCAVNAKQEGQPRKSRGWEEGLIALALNCSATRDE